MNYFIFERISRSCVVPAKSEVNEVWEILQINISRFIQLVHFKNKMVVQCLSPCLPIQGLRVRSLVGELTSHLHHSQKAKPSNRSSIGWLSLEPTHCSNGVSHSNAVLLSFHLTSGNLFPTHTQTTTNPASCMGQPKIDKTEAIL